MPKNGQNPLSMTKLFADGPYVKLEWRVNILEQSSANFVLLPLNKPREKQIQ